MCILKTLRVHLPPLVFPEPRAISPRLHPDAQVFVGNRRIGASSAAVSLGANATQLAAFAEANTALNDEMSALKKTLATQENAFENVSEKLSAQEKEVASLKEQLSTQAEQIAAQAKDMAALQATVARLAAAAK